MGAVYPPTSMLYFDIGANVGRWSLANVHTADKIIAVEASPRTFQQLTRNTEHEYKIYRVNAAICDAAEPFVDFFECPDAHSGLSTTNEEWLTSEHSRCHARTMDQLIDAHGVPDLIKIDVEGGEHACLRSLTRKVDVLCFEWASELREMAVACMDHLEGLGFSAFAIQFEDDYRLRPDRYTDKQAIVALLNRTTPKLEWVMIWAT